MAQATPFEKVNAVEFVSAATVKKGDMLWERDWTTPYRVTAVACSNGRVAIQGQRYGLDSESWILATITLEHADSDTIRRVTDRRLMALYGHHQR